MTENNGFHVKPEFPGWYQNFVWIKRFKLCHPFRSDCATQTGLNCATCFGASLPVLPEMECWLKEEIIGVLPASAIGKVFAYTLKLWPCLTRYVQDGRLQTDNNMVENSIRPVALGRKNYLFAGSTTQPGRQPCFTHYCKINNVKPFA